MLLMSRLPDLWVLIILVEINRGAILKNCLHVILFLFGLSLLTTTVAAEVNDTSMADVEIYGKASNLLRINPQHRFDIKVHNHSDGTCEVDSARIERILKGVLQEQSIIFESGDYLAQFSLHFEFFGNLDVHNHCMLGYSLGIERNNMRNDPDGDELSGKYDYDNSYPLLKIMGMLHTDTQVLNRSLEEQVEIATEKVFSTLKSVQQDLGE